MRVDLAASMCLALMAVGGSAYAQPRPNLPPGVDRSNSQFTLRREEAGGVEGQTARARARAGDCAGALPGFDAAIRGSGSMDPTLRRDRGLCHDKLGDPFPAMEDFRFYLTARPDAPDSDQIRQRLAALESAAGPGVQASSSEPTSGSETLAGANASMSIGTGGASAKGSTTTSEHAVIGPKPGEARQPFDYYTRREKEVAAAKASPLRYGSGIVLGPFINVPRIFLGDGATSDVGFAAGATLRYSTGSTLTLVSEFGFSGVGRGGEIGSQSGPLVMGGLELRFPISQLAGDHLLLRGGVGYERNVIRGTRATIDDLLGRFAFGYRHVFATAVGLEALVDGGPVLVFPEGEASRVNGVIGLSVAFVVGF